MLFEYVCYLSRYVIESERSERSEHTVVLSLTFLSIYIYSVTKFSVKYMRPLLRRITENTRDVRGDACLWDERMPLASNYGSVTLYPFATR